MLINSLLIVTGVLLDFWFISKEFKNKFISATVLKGLAAAFFVALGAVQFFRNETFFGLLVVLGLALGMAGDILLALKECLDENKGKKVFALGILAFMVGHYLYIASLFYANSSILNSALIICMILSFSAIPPLLKRITAPSKGLYIFGISYLVIVVGMFSSSLANLIFQEISAWKILFCTGALLFLISDFVLVYNTFGPKKTKTLRVINLLTYYAGQVIIALTIFYFPSV